MGSIRGDKSEKGYYSVGTNEHSAVKICFWTRRSLLNQGFCYKQQFYGIESHRCLQMTPSLHFCTHRCIFCWRDINITYPKLEGSIDDPMEIIEDTIKAQIRLLIGFKSNKKVNKDKLEEAFNPNQCAISLAGEPTLYPKLGELIEVFHAKKFTTFLVTNGTQPEELKKLNPLPTQLCITLPAPDENTYKQVCSPVENHWNDILQSLEIIKELKCRKVIRLTLARNLNFKDAQKYAQLILIAGPDYIEPKSYIAVGYSTNRLSYTEMLSISEIKQFSLQIAKETGYLIKDQQNESRVVLLCRDENTYSKRKLDKNFT